MIMLFVVSSRMLRLAAEAERVAGPACRARAMAPDVARRLRRGRAWREVGEERHRELAVEALQMTSARSRARAWRCCRSAPLGRAPTAPSAADGVDVAALILAHANLDRDTAPALRGSVEISSSPLTIRRSARAIVEMRTPRSAARCRSTATRISGLLRLTDDLGVGEAGIFCAVRQQPQRVARTAAAGPGPSRLTWIGYDAFSPPPIAPRTTTVGLIARVRLHHLRGRRRPPRPA